MQSNLGLGPLATLKASLPFKASFSRRHSYRCLIRGAAQRGASITRIGRIKSIQPKELAARLFAAALQLPPEAGLPAVHAGSPQKSVAAIPSTSAV